jgi:hypothetical protein
LNISNAEELALTGDVFIVPIVSVPKLPFAVMRYLMDKKIEKQFIFLPIAMGMLRTSMGNDELLRSFSDCLNLLAGPVGCRDFDSCKMLQEIGYNAYLSGCVTNTLPRRNPNRNYNKLYIIDAPNEAVKNMPGHLKRDAVYLTQSNTDAGLNSSAFEFSRNRYELLRDTAMLVVTARYHIATPCVAMGIPVILLESPDLKKEFDVRLDSLNPNIPYYSRDEFDTVDWNRSELPDFEYLKSTMIDLIVSRIISTVKIYEYHNITKKFFMPSITRFETVFSKQLFDDGLFLYEVVEMIDKPFLQKIEGDFSYYLFGLSDIYLKRNRCFLLYYIQKNYPNAHFLGFVDSYKKGIHFGKEVIHPDDMKVDDDTYVIVSAYTANDYVKKLFDERGYNTKHLYLIPKELLFYCYQL